MAVSLAYKILCSSGKIFIHLSISSFVRHHCGCFLEYQCWLISFLDIPIITNVIALYIINSSYSPLHYLAQSNDHTVHCMYSVQSDIFVLRVFIHTIDFIPVNVFPFFQWHQKPNQWRYRTRWRRWGRDSRTSSEG
jgi:hypothetical protein